MILVQQRLRFLQSIFISDFFNTPSYFFRRSSTCFHRNKSTIHHPPLVRFPADFKNFNSLPSRSTEGYSIELVDTEAWRISSGLAYSWGREGQISDPRTPVAETCAVNSTSNRPDFDEIEDMKIRGNLFFKILRNSREHEEYCVRLSGSKAKGKQGMTKFKAISGQNVVPRVRENVKNTENKNEDLCPSENKSRVRTDVRNKNEYLVGDDDICMVKKKVRVPSFNKLAAPYVFPFCLDIFISKTSVRACVVHRVTNKVVAVAHSISKDLKFDLESRKDLTACVTVGAVLARKALADDIYSVVYTSRKGEIIEGKVQDVLQSIIDNGVCVKIKLKKSGR